MGPGPGDLDHQPWLGEEVLKHRLPVSTPDLRSWAPTEGLGPCPRVTVKPVVIQTSGLFPCSGRR